MNDLLDLEALAMIGASRGRKAQEVAVRYVRDLGEEDLKDLQTPAPLGTQPTPIKALRAPHHKIAQLLASGTRAVEISRITGYSQSRISILQEDPTFGELVEHYKAQVAEAFTDYQERLAAVGTTALEILQERLDERPDDFAEGMLLKIVESTYDRSVAPAKSGPKALGGGAAAAGGVQVSINFIPGAKEEEPKVVEGTELRPES